MAVAVVGPMPMPMPVTVITLPMMVMMIMIVVIVIMMVVIVRVMVVVMVVVGASVGLEEQVGPHAARVLALAPLAAPAHVSISSSWSDNPLHKAKASLLLMAAASALRCSVQGTCCFQPFQIACPTWAAGGRGE